MAKRKMIPTPADNIAKQIMGTYRPQDAQEIQDVVKRISLDTPLGTAQ